MRQSEITPVLRSGKKMAHAWRRGLLVALLSVFSLGSHYVAADPNPPGPYKLVMAGRGGSPYPKIDNYKPDLSASGKGSEYSVQMSRHHIIPYETLKDFFNAVAKKTGHLELLNSFWTGFGGHLKKYGEQNGVVLSPAVLVDYAQADTLVQEFGDGRVTAGGPHTPEGWDTFHEFYTWMPWNLFVGPNARSDDPGNKLDAKAKIVVNDAATWNAIEKLYTDMKIYLDKPTEANLKTVREGLIALYGHETVYPMQKDQWVLDRGKYHLKP